MDEVVPLLYDELRGLAGGFMKGERPNHTLQPTALVHEACLRLMGAEPDWNDRRQFFRELVDRCVGPAAEFVGEHLGKVTPERRLLLRPPGALPERQFLDTCYRCGSCLVASRIVGSSAQTACRRLVGGYRTQGRLSERH